MAYRYDRSDSYGEHESNAQSIYNMFEEDAEKATKAREEALANSTDLEVLQRRKLREERYARELEEADEAYAIYRASKDAEDKARFRLYIQKEIDDCKFQIEGITEELEENQKLAKKQDPPSYLQGMIKHQVRLIEEYSDKITELSLRLED